MMPFRPSPTSSGCVSFNCWTFRRCVGQGLRGFFFSFFFFLPNKTIRKVLGEGRFTRTLAQVGAGGGGLVAQKGNKTHSSE